MTPSEPGPAWHLQLRNTLWDTLRTRRDRRVWVVCLYFSLFGGGGGTLCVKPLFGRDTPLLGPCLMLAALSVPVWLLLAWWARAAPRRDGSAAVWLPVALILWTEPDFEPGPAAESAP